MGLRDVVAQTAKSVYSWANPETRSTGLLDSLSVGSYLPSYKNWSTKTAVEEGYEKHAVVYRVVDLIATTMASVKWEVVKPDGDKVENHPAVDLIQQPSEKHTWNRIIQYISGFKSLSGDAFLLYLQEGDAQELLPLFPGYIKADTDKRGNIEKYHYGTGKNSQVYDPEQIIHSQFLSYRPGWEGMAPLKPAGRIIDTDNEAVDWHKGTLERGGRPSGALKAKGELSTEQREQIKKRRDEMMDPSNDEAHIPIFGADLDWLQFSQSAKEMDYLESRQLNKAEIADVYGVPVDLLNFGENSTYENQREAKKRFWSMTVIPRIQEIKSDLNLQLASQYEGDIQFDYNLAGTEAVIASRLDRAEEAQKYWAMGVPFSEYMGAVSQRVKERFREEKEKVLDAYKRNGDFRTVIQRQEKPWLTLLKSSKKAVLEHFANQLIDQLQERSTREIREYEPWNQQVQSKIEEQTQESVDTILSTTQTEVKQTIEEAKADGMGKEAILSELGETYSKFEGYRTSFIARSEVHSAAQMGLNDAATKSQAVKKKKWISSRDSRVRDSHQPGMGVDGQVRPMKQPFDLSGGQLMYPGDQSGPVDEWVNCRCTNSYVVD